MGDLFLVVLLLGGYIGVMRYVLPKIGVDT